MLKIAVFVSGGGTNLQSIIDKINDKYLVNCKIMVVLSNKNNVYALERAKKYGLKTEVVVRNDKKLEDYDNKLIASLSKYELDLIVLAGFTSILGKTFINRYEKKIINVHPSLIPAFSGKGFYGIIPHQKALEYGVKISGATVHFVDLNTDEGPIILRSVCVKNDDTPEKLQKRILEKAEWLILPEAIKLISEGKVRIQGRKVYIES